MAEKGFVFGPFSDKIEITQQDPNNPDSDSPPLATDGDLRLFERYGEKGLKNFKYYGVLFRLANSGLVDKNTLDL